MVIVEYERTWCDYNTHCPFGEKHEVGSYECSKCKHFERSLGETESRFTKPGNYDRYFEILTGKILCTKDEKYKKDSDSVDSDPDAF